MRVDLFKGGGIHRWYLRLVASNGKTLALSEGYLTKWNAKRAAAKNFPGIPLVDATTLERVK